MYGGAVGFLEQLREEFEAATDRAGGAAGVLDAEGDDGFAVAGAEVDKCRAAGAAGR